MKKYLLEVDESILRDIFYCAQMAMNDVKTAEMLSSETGISEERIDALTPVAIDLSMEQPPKYKTEKDIASLQQEMTGFRMEVESNH